jgi:hypothetical protein
MSGPQVLGAIAARVVGRPVKLVLRRDQMFGPVGHRAPTRQTLRLGTDKSGALTALDHHTKTVSSTFDDFFEPASDISHTLYASGAIATSHEAVRSDIGTPLFMRAPGEAPGSIALESAIDEMAQMGDVRGAGSFTDLSPVNMGCVQKCAIKAVGQHSCLGQWYASLFPSIKRYFKKPRRRAWATILRIFVSEIPP